MLDRVADELTLEGKERFEVELCSKNI